MNRIFMDLEMNPISKEYCRERKICRQEVIEFGAVRLDQNSREIDTFQCYVRPAYNAGVMPYITGLTGIRTEQVADAELFAEALQRFLLWCGSEYEIYSWSDADFLQLQQEMQLKNIPQTPGLQRMFLHWHDLQKEYGEMLYSERQVALKMAVDNAGLTFFGRAHTALSDAKAAAGIYREMHEGRVLKKLSTMLGSAREPLGTSLGDLLGGISLQSA